MGTFLEVDLPSICFLRIKVFIRLGLLVILKLVSIVLLSSFFNSLKNLLEYYLIGTDFLKRLLLFRSGVVYERISLLYDNWLDCVNRAMHLSLWSLGIKIEYASLLYLFRILKNYYNIVILMNNLYQLVLKKGWL